MHPGTLVYALYRDERSAVKAVEALVDARFPASDIGAFMPGADRSPDEEIELKHVTGVPAGAALGAVLGALGGALVVASGGLVVAGPLVLMLEGAVAGGAFGTLTGALGGLAYWRETLTFPKHAFDEGGVLIGVNAHDARLEEARAMLSRAGGEHIGVATKREPRETHAAQNPNATPRM